MNAAQKTKRSSPLSIRLSSDERSRLEREAGSVPLGTFIKSKIFGEPAGRVRRPQSVRDERTIAQLLARLGASGLAAHIQELADAARSGSLACDDEVASLIRAACADIESMRSMLVAALGLKGPASKPEPTSSTPCQAFESVSGQGGVR
ncbi:hypothetical protein [Sphingomonas colocasiae]|uniref:Mobilization protein n=1 Tax=Sphingomonas colocasiae TaxID=1848973 RepID=A0ABS7PSG2_9SPHN|nr:hypothetical protein [Sphingomonas colocasiae]MBY8824275.1 hypothetical protein [Sphingomonas colocasiae]